MHEPLIRNTGTVFKDDSAMKSNIKIIKLKVFGKSSGNLVYQGSAKYSP